MYSGRTINLVAPLVWEANVSPAAAAVYAEVIRNAMRDSGIVAGPAVVSLSTVDPVLYPGLLAGEPTRQVSEGVAVFNGLSVNVPGPYTLTVEAEEDLLQMHSTSPTTGTITLWRVYNIPAPGARSASGARSSTWGTTWSWGTTSRSSSPAPPRA